MTSRQETQPEPVKEHPGNSPETIPDDGFLSYYRDGMENVGGLKVKWKIRVVTGPEATRPGARQAQAIKELLQWATQYMQRQART